MSESLRGSWGSSRRFVVLATAAVALVSIFFHWQALQRTPSNTDEFIYLSLARSLSQGTGNTLQGSLILNALPPEMYDHPVFNHPPGFPLLLVPFVAAPKNAVIVPILALCLAALSVAWVGAKFLVDRTLTSRLLFLMVLIAAFFDPILSFCSRRIWMDGVLAMWIGIAYAALIFHSSSRRIPWALVLACLCLAAAVGTKILMAVFLVPAAVLIFLQSGQQKWRDLLILCVPSLFVLAVWEFVFHAATGQWLPKWLSIDADVLRAHPFMAARADQPLLFFPMMLVLLCPLAALTIPAACLFIRKSGGEVRRVIALTLSAILLYVGVLVILGMGGFSKESRYLSPIMPLLGMLFAGVLAALRNPHAESVLTPSQKIFLAACVLAILAGGFLAGFHLVALSLDEPISLARVVPGLFGHWFR